MKYIIAIWALVSASMAYAACTTHTICDARGCVMCTTCCYASGSCTTNCF